MIMYIRFAFPVLFTFPFPSHEWKISIHDIDRFTNTCISVRTHEQIYKYKYT